MLDCWSKNYKIVWCGSKWIYRKYIVQLYYREGRGKDVKVGKISALKLIKWWHQEIVIIYYIIYRYYLSSIYNDPNPQKLYIKRDPFKNTITKSEWTLKEKFKLSNPQEDRKRKQKKKIKKTENNHAYTRNGEKF